MTDLNLEKHINREISTCYANLRNFKIVLGCRISSFVFMEHVTLIHGIALKN